MAGFGVVARARAKVGPGPRVLQKKEKEHCELISVCITSDRDQITDITGVLLCADFVEKDRKSVV